MTNNANLGFPNLEVIIGTYEEFIIGYRLNLNSESNNKLTLSFASHSHNSSVRCVAHSEHYFASGGADDRIVIYDLKSRKEHCMLTHHNGTVNCVQFIGHTHLISGSSDGMLSIVRIGNWQVEKIWDKAHKGAAIVDIAVHSSNKLALTLGADCTLRTWNLIKGRQAYVINLNSKSKDPKSIQFIKWAPDGVRFVLCGGFETDIWSLDTGGIVQSIEHTNKVSYCLFYDNNNLIVCFENGNLSMLDLDNKKSKEIEAHSTRIKSVDMFDEYLFTCSSNGEVKAWTKELNVVATGNTGCRNICMHVVPSTWIKEEENVDSNKELQVDHLSSVIVECEKKTVKPKTKIKANTVEKPTVVLEVETPKKKKRSKSVLLNEKTLKNVEDLKYSARKSARDVRVYAQQEDSVIREITPKKKKRKSKNKI